MTKTIVTGSQGDVKIVEIGDQKSVAVKTSKYTDYSIELENTVLTELERLKLPHFCKVVGYSEKHGEIAMTAIEGPSIYAFVKKNDLKVSLDLAYASMAAVAAMQIKTGMSHGDLHTGNVLIEKTDVDLCIYEFEKETFAFKTHGYNPVIIDFGHSVMPEGKMLATLGTTDVGYFPFSPDKIGDARIFTKLIRQSVLDRSRETGKPEPVIAAGFVKTVKDTFGSIPLERFNHAWFQRNTFASVLDRVEDMLYFDIEKRVTIGKESILNQKKPSDTHDDDTMLDTLHIIIGQISAPLRDYEIGENEMTQEEREWVKDLDGLNLEKYKRVACVMYSTFCRQFEIFRSIVPEANSLGFLKNLCSKSTPWLTKKYPASVLYLKRTLDRFVRAIEPRLAIGSSKMVAKRDRLYSSVPIKDMFDMLSIVPKRKVTSLKVGMKVRIFDCANFENHKTIFLETLADVKNLRKIYLKAKKKETISSVD